MNAFTVPATNVIVIGASAGGIRAVRTLLNKLPEDIPAAVFIVVHTSPSGPGMLATVLDRVTPLTVVTAEDGMTIRDGYVYVAPPDFHLIVDGDQVRLSHGPREHRFRPAVDPLFRTAAQHYGRRAIGVVLSGHMADGTQGLIHIKEAKGIAVVQDPDDAEVPSMPLNAMRRGTVDYVLPVEEMARVITGLVMNAPQRRAGSPPRTPARPSETPGRKHPGTDALEGRELAGPPSPLTCPDCGGSLWEIKDQGLVRYCCHVGHRFNGDSLRDDMDEKLEELLWTALRAIEEAIELRTRMTAQAKNRHLSELTAALQREIADMQQRADALRELLIQWRRQERPRTAARRRRQAHG